MSFPIPLALSLLVGCPDPTYAPAIDPDAPVVPSSGDPAQPGDGLRPGDPVVGNEPTVDASVTPGEGVVISGTVTYEGTKTGRIRLDVLTTKGRNPHVLAKTLELPQFGDWAVELPKDFGTVNVMAFLDQNGDGPTADDPATALAEPVLVGSEPIEGLSLVLTEGADVRSLLHSEPPPEPPDDAPMPDADASPQGEPGAPPLPGQPVEGGPGNPGGGPDGAHESGLDPVASEAADGPEAVESPPTGTQP